MSYFYTLAGLRKDSVVAVATECDTIAFSSVFRQRTPFCGKTSSWVLPALSYFFSSSVTASNVPR